MPPFHRRMQNDFTIDELSFDILREPLPKLLPATGFISKCLLYLLVKLDCTGAF